MTILFPIKIVYNIYKQEKAAENVILNFEWDEDKNQEDRYNTIGMVNDILFVVYTERKENIRLISARLATKTERSIYYDTDSYFG